MLESAIDIALEKRDPIKRQERREQREARKKAATCAGATVGGTSPDVQPGEFRPDGIPGSPAAPVAPRTRYVPAQVRDELLIRADHQCEYVGPGRVRCRARWGLQIDHIAPYGRGGATAKANLRVLCEAHNRLHAEQCFGRDTMRRKIVEARGERARCVAGT